MAKVVIVGAGFGGLKAAQCLGNSALDVLVIDKENHHLFQPLLYQVATAGLSPADIAVPIRRILHSFKNMEVRLAEVKGVDLTRQVVLTDTASFSFDYLVMATGSRYNYFGHEDWERVAPCLKNISDAVQLRERILKAFEMAESEEDPERVKSLLTFVIVGGGPTGVEMAGALSELCNRALVKDFRKIDPRKTRIVLVEAGSRILSSFPEVLSQEATKALVRLGVEVETSARVEDVDESGVMIQGKRLSTPHVIWAAGVRATQVGMWLNTKVDAQGRCIVNGNLSVPAYPNVFVIGDAAHYEMDGQVLPALAPVALQEGAHVAKVIRSSALGCKHPGSFRYRDKGNLTAVGRSFAIADIANYHLKGRIAWWVWVIVHIYYLIGFRNRLVVMMEWAWSYLTFQKGARLITKRK